jgi:predicted molibdopterin-dependent oxidoreductase YjgC
MTYAKLREGSGIQWPCTDVAPDGTERLYTDARFHTDPETSESYGHDLATGAELGEQAYRAKDPDGRAFLQSAEYESAPEMPDDDYPLLLTTGRVIFQFHTRTKTARVPELQEAAPDVWAEFHADDAAAAGVDVGDLVEIQSRRGRVVAPVRIGTVRRGVVFVPFHYGYFDRDAPDSDERPRAANELTETVWDPVSKQPMFKVAAVRVSPYGRTGG